LSTGDLIDYHYRTNSFEDMLVDYVNGAQNLVDEQSVTVWEARDATA
jgi:hypothetical protein